MHEPDPTNYLDTLIRSFLDIANARTKTRVARQDALMDAGICILCETEPSDGSAFCSATCADAYWQR